jgi:predicted regulator of Ras-like GTPase activity (Roadblock/LC7/MglB family)
MPFKSLLGKLVANVPGAKGAIIVDWEGEEVDHVARMDDYELKVLGAHKGVILDHLRAAVARLEGAELEEIVVTTTHNQTLIMPVSLEYCLVLTLNRSDALGRAQFEMRRCLGDLRREID